MDWQELLKRGGQANVPCLRITNEAYNSQWLYDSERIIGYLRGRFDCVMAGSPQRVLELFAREDVVESGLRIGSFLASQARQ